MEARPDRSVRLHVDVPAGVSAVEARFSFLSAIKPDQGRVVVTPDMLNLQWESVSLYPAGYYTRRIPVVGERDPARRLAGGDRASPRRGAPAAANRITYGASIMRTWSIRRSSPGAISARTTLATT